MNDLRWKRNREHWTNTLDAQNLQDGTTSISLKTQVALANTEDVRLAMAHLQPLSGKTILDLGGGLGLTAILFAAEDATVVIADISLPRLKEAARVLRENGHRGSILMVQSIAEQLPFLAGTMDRAFTKSVLIHTDLPRATAELDRVLHPGGRAAFIEPTTGNPFVNLYRKIAAPKIWSEITSYFTERETGTLRRGLRRRMVRVGHSYLFAFFATPWNYSLHMPRAFRLCEWPLITLDRALFRALPVLRKKAWFVIVKVRPRRR